MSEDRPADRPFGIDAGASSRSGGPGVGAQPVRLIESDQLMRGASHVAIRHANCIYILRQTRFGKLILTK